MERLDGAQAFQVLRQVTETGYTWTQNPILLQMLWQQLLDIDAEKPPETEYFYI